jgi:hypothetical protein
VQECVETIEMYTGPADAIHVNFAISVASVPMWADLRRKIRLGATSRDFTVFSIWKTITETIEMFLVPRIQIVGAACSVLDERRDITLVEPRHRASNLVAVDTPPQIKVCFKIRDLKKIVFFVAADQDRWFVVQCKEFSVGRADLNHSDFTVFV